MFVENSILLFLLSKHLDKNFKLEKRDYLIFGILLGLMGLSRQWAFLLFPAYAYFLFFKNSKDIRKKVFKFLVYSFSIAFIVCSWFYFKLFFEFGTFTAFNMTPTNFSLYNQPIDFYLINSDEILYLFTKPIRPYLNSFLGIIYSDVWGDYWGYFVFTSKYLDIGRNQLAIGDYLARVNLISTIPTIFIFIGLLRSKLALQKTNLEKFQPFLNFIKLSALFTIFGYFWFLIKFPVSDAIKATYLIQFFHLITIPLIFYLNYLQKTKKKMYGFFITTLMLVFVHNFSAYLSHF